MTHDDQNQGDFDPQAEFYDEAGFRYRSFAAYLLRDEDVCPLNRRLKHVQRVYEGTENDCPAYTAWISIHWQEHERQNPKTSSIVSRWAHATACARRDFASTDRKHPRDCGRATRAGVARAVAAPPDAIHPADEPEIPGGLGA